MTKVIDIGTPKTVTIDTQGPTQIVTVAATGPQGPMGPPGPVGNAATGSYGSFYDTGSYLAASATAIYSMSLSTTDISNGVFISGSDRTKIKFTNAGTYNIQFSAQFSNNDNSQQEATIWLRKNNGSSLDDLADTAGVVTIPAKKNTQIKGQIITSWNYLVNLVDNDFLQLLWSPSVANVITLETIASGSNPTHPRSPSLILTAQRVDTFLSNTGSFSGSFNGSLNGTASWASNAITASYALSTATLINTSSFVTTSSFNAYTSSVNSSLSNKANLNGGNNFTGNQNVTKLIASDSVVAPIYQGTTSKVQITNGATETVISFAGGLYSSLILDTFLKIQENLTLYGLQTVYMIIDPSNPETIYFTSITNVSSPPADNLFSDTNVVYTAVYQDGNILIKVQNQTGAGTLDFKSIVRAFTTSG